MKPSVLIFCAGLALGVAGTLALRRPGPSPGAEDPSVQGGDRSSSRAYIESSSRSAKRGERSTAKRRSGEKGRHSSGDARTDLMDLLQLVGGLEDESELDLMNLLRKASLMTMINEGEALDLLQLLANPSVPGELEIDDDFREVAGVIVFSRLCELNGPEAMRMAHEGALMEAWRGDKDEFVTMGMNSWVAADPEGAQLWFEGLVGEIDEVASNGGDEEDMDGMMELLESDDFRKAYFSGMAKHDPEALEQRIAGLGHEEVRKAMQAEVLAALVANEQTQAGLEVLLEKSSGLPEAHLEAVKKLSKQDPQAAASWVESQPPGSGRDQEIIHLGGLLMKEEGMAGVEWYMAQELVDEGRQADRLARVVNHLSKDDVRVATEWLEQQPDDATRDNAEVSMAWASSRRGEWQESMVWVAGVESEASRQKTLDGLLNQGWNKEEKAFSAALIEAAEAAGFGAEVEAFERRVGGR